MRLDYISLKRFRNFEEVSIKLNKNSAIIIGENGQGKTNLLEAINIASSGKSWRTRNNVEFIKHNEEDCIISAEFIKNDINKKIEILFNNNTEKIIRINKKIVESDKDYWRDINIIHFSPEDINIINGAPALRRSFLNTFSSQLSKMYREHLINYNRIVSQRNIALVRNEKLEIEIWTEKLIEEGIWLTEKRVFNMKFFVKYFKEFHSMLSDTQDRKIKNISVIYRSSLGFHKELNNSENEPLLKIDTDVFKQRLNEVKDKEILYQETIIGPHRDDIIFVLDEFEARKFSSRGEQRLLALALKLAQYKVIEETLEEFPIILIDDVLSELDENKRKSFLRNIDKSAQVFIAGTDTRIFDILDTTNIVKLEIKHGKINLFN